MESEKITTSKTEASREKNDDSHLKDVLDNLKKITSYPTEANLPTLLAILQRSNSCTHLLDGRLPDCIKLTNTFISSISENSIICLIRNFMSFAEKNMEVFEYLQIKLMFCLFLDDLAANEDDIGLMFTDHLEEAMGLVNVFIEERLIEVVHELRLVDLKVAFEATRLFI